MSVEKRIYDFLLQKRKKDFCDDCIASKISRPTGGNVNRHQVRNATSAFEVTKEFARAFVTCSLCGQNKKAIRAL